MIHGNITLDDTEQTVIQVTDENIVQGSLALSMSTSINGRFAIGTFNAARIKITVVDENAAQHNFENAQIVLFEDVENPGAASSTCIGIYKVAADKIKRKGATVSLVGYDRALDFDIEFTGSRSTKQTPSAWISAAASAAGVSQASGNSSIIADLPNNNVHLSMADAQIQSWRDVVIWACKALCCNAVVNRFGEFEIRRIKYLVDGDHAVLDHTITEQDRLCNGFSFSDTRTYIKFLTAYTDKGVRKNYTSSWTATDTQARAGEYTSIYNPAVPTENADAVNSAWLAYISPFLQREVKCKVFGTPDIKLGDTVAFTGGRVDVRGRIMGVITDIERTYNGATTIMCHAPTAVIGG